MSDPPKPKVWQRVVLRLRPDSKTQTSKIQSKLVFTPRSRVGTKTSPLSIQPPPRQPRINIHIVPTQSWAAEGFQEKNMRQKIA